MGARPSAILRCAHLFRQVSFHTVVLGARSVNIGVVRSAVLFVAGARDARARPSFIPSQTRSYTGNYKKSNDACAVHCLCNVVDVKRTMWAGAQRTGRVPCRASQSPQIAHRSRILRHTLAQPERTRTMLPSYFPDPGGVGRSVPLPREQCQSRCPLTRVSRSYVRRPPPRL